MIYFGQNRNDNAKNREKPGQNRNDNAKNWDKPGQTRDEPDQTRNDLTDSKSAKRPPFVPLYRPVSRAILAACGMSGLGCFDMLAQRADYSAGWTVNAGLRDLAAAGNVTVNTIKTLLRSLEAGGFIRVDSAERSRTLITLTAMTDAESGKSVSKFDTDQKNLSKKSGTVSKTDTDFRGFSALFPDFVVRAGQKTRETVSKFDTEGKNAEKTVSKIDTAKSVSKFDTEAENTPLNNPPSMYINNINKYNTADVKKITKSAKPTLDEVAAYFAGKGYATDPADFYHKNEAVGWTWTDRTGKNRKIKNWKSAAYQWEQVTKRRGAVNWASPQKPEEQLFCWYYDMTVPGLLQDPTARDNRWYAEKGSFAFIFRVAQTLERAKEIIIYGTEKLETAKFSPTIRAIANNAVSYNDDISSRANRGK